MTVNAGLDTFCPISLVSFAVLKRLGVTDISPPTMGESLNFLDGTTTVILGEVNLVVTHQTVSTTVLCLVVRTVTPTLGVEILLGPDFMSKRSKRMVLEFPPQDQPIVTHFVAAAAVTPAPAEVIDGGDFTLRRRNDRSWEFEWQWIKEPPSRLRAGARVYWSKLKSAELKTMFEAEVDKWCERGYVVEYTEAQMGPPQCILAWNPIPQVHKSTKVRPTLDYKLINPFILCRESVSQSEICHKVLREWRKYQTAFLVDVEKAYMNVHAAKHLLPFQAVWVHGKLYCMTRMGFGLNIAPRVLKVLIEHILSSAQLTDIALPYRDDLLIGSCSFSESDRRKSLETLERARKILLQHGMPTKAPIDILDVSRGPNRALGLELFNKNGCVHWRRRSDQDGSFTDGKPTFKDVAGFIGRVCPGNYPVMGSLRPAALHILSENGRQAQARDWIGLASDDVAKKCHQLLDMIRTNDEVTGEWIIPDTNSWVLCTDASAQAMGCCVMTLASWESTPDASCPIIEDHCWLVKNNRVHINVLELEAVIKGFKVLGDYAKPRHSVLLVLDSKVVVSWINNLKSDKRVTVSGLYQILAERRLAILRELIAEYDLTVIWVESAANPADKLTRVPSDWQITHDSPVSCGAVLPTDRDIAVIQSEDADCRRLISELDSNGQLEIIGGIAYRKVTLGRSYGLQMLIPSELADEVIRRVHEEDLGHAGWKCTWHAVKRLYFIQGTNVAARVQEILAECKICVVKNAKLYPQQDFHSERVAPWVEVFADVMQLSSPLDGLPHLLLVVIDNYSKFVEAFALTRKTGDLVAACIESVCGRYGGWKVLRVDNGLEFKNELLRAVADRYGFEIQFGAVRNPQAQATVERVNATIQGIVRALTFGTSAHWSTILEKALSCYRSRPHVSLGYRTPREVLFGFPEGKVPQNFDPDVFWADAYDYIQTAEAEFMLRSGSDIPEHTPGQQVLVRIDQRRRLKDRYSWTIATIIRYLGKGSYLLQDENGRQSAFNAKSLSRLKVPIGPLEQPAQPVAPDSPQGSVPLDEPAPIEEQRNDTSELFNHTDHPPTETIDTRDEGLRRSKRSVRKPVRFTRSF